MSTTAIAAEPSGGATRTIEHWIGGERTTGLGSRELAVFDPATGEATGTVVLGEREDVDRAVEAASAAFPAWAGLPTSARVRVIRRFQALLTEHSAVLMDAVCGEHGKVRQDAEGELRRGLDVVEVACWAPALLKGEHSDQVADGLDTHSLRQPLGVCAGITPFNFPAMVPLWMFPLALVAGNTFVLKPSERDPSVSLLMAEMLRDAGAPDGVLNVVQGDKVTVDAILNHPGIAAVSFVGSTPVARYVYARAAAAGKRVQAFGGAKNHMVVLPDADMDQAADALTSAGYGSTGQRCMAVAAAVAVGAAGDALIPKLRERIEALTVGPASDPDADMGPLTTSQARNRVVTYIDRAIEAGAELVADGRQVGVRGFEAGYFVGPTLFDRVTPNMEIYQDEVFGPVLVVLRADTFDTAMEILNESQYGNGAAIFTRSGGAARRFAREATAGMIGINVPIPVPVSYYSFGGWKQSLFGDQHLHGPEGLRFYTRAKVVTSRWPEDEPEGVDLAFPTPAA